MWGERRMGGRCGLQTSGVWTVGMSPVTSVDDTRGSSLKTPIKL